MSVYSCVPNNLLDDIEEIEETQNDKIKIDAPPWPVVVELMMKNIPEAEKIYFEKEKNRSVKLMFNLTNFMAILGKIM